MRHNELRLDWVSWLLRAFALLVLATFPVWWIVIWRCGRPRMGFWEAGKETLLSCLAELVYGDR